MIPPAVEPTQEPVTMKKKRNIENRHHHREKVFDTKPVVVSIEITLNDASRVPFSSRYLEFKTRIIATMEETTKTVIR